MFQLTHFLLFFLTPVSRSFMCDVFRRLSPLFPPLTTKEMANITGQVRRNSRKTDEVTGKPSTRKMVKYIVGYSSPLLLANCLQKKAMVSNFYPKI